MHGVEHAISLFLNDVSKNTNFESNDSISQGNIKFIWIWSISQAPFYIQTKSYRFCNSNIVLSSGNDTIMAVYFMGM